VPGTRASLADFLLNFVNPFASFVRSIRCGDEENPRVVSSNDGFAFSPWRNRNRSKAWDGLQCIAVPLPPLALVTPGSLKADSLAGQVSAKPWPFFFSVGVW